MAMTSFQIWNCNAAGDDTNGGGFDPSLTAGMFTDLHCTLGTTSAPVVTSASYSFVAGDIGSRICVALGTNWILGLYSIVSVAGGAATLRAALNTALMKFGQTTGTYATANGSLNSATVGCSTTATNTNGATWSIDRSIPTSAYQTGTNGSTNAAGTAFTPGNGYTPVKADVGNTIQTTAGSGTLSYFTITAISGSTWIIDKTAGTSITGITWSMGGALASIGELGRIGAPLTNVYNAGQRLYLAGGSNQYYTLTNATANTPGGPFTGGNAIEWIMEGYNTNQGDFASIGPVGFPVIDAGSQTNINIFSVGTLAPVNIMVNGKNNTGVNGFLSTAGSWITTCYAIHFNASATNYGFQGGVTLGSSIGCYAFDCGIGIDGQGAVCCEADSCVTGFKTAGSAGYLAASRSIAHGCTNGFVPGGAADIYEGCTSYFCTSSGFNPNSVNNDGCVFLNCADYGSTVCAYDTYEYEYLINCASGGAYSTGRTNPVTKGAVLAPFRDPLASQILLTVDPFKNLNGGLTSVNGVNLTVDSVNPLKVTPDGYTSWANDVGLKLLILPGTSWIAGVYTITGILGNSWILNYSPAATSTTGGTWRMSDFRPNSLAGGGALLQGTAQLIPTQAG